MNQLVKAPMFSLCDIKSGKSNTRDAEDNGEYIFFDRSKVIKKSSRYLYDCEALIIAGEGTEFLPKHYKGKFDLHQRAYALHNFKPSINVKYLYYYLHHLKDYLPSVAVGATVKSLRRRHFENLPVVIFPIKTQQKIVSKLDSILAEIDKAKAMAEANSKNSHSLYSSAVDVIFNNLDNKYVKLSDCSHIGYGYTSKSSIEFNGPQYLRITDIQEDNVDWLLVPRIQSKVSVVKKFLLKDGDIVFARTGATTGKSFLIKDSPVSVFASYLIRVEADRSLVLPEYLRHFFKSKGYWNTINSGISGTAQGGFNASKLNELLFPLPDLDKQKKIVGELNKIEMLSITAKKSFDMKVTLLNSLKKTILKQAFNGELVKVA